MEDFFQAEALVIIHNAALFEINQNSKRQISTGELKIIQIASQKITLLSIGDFTCSLTKELSIMRSTHNHYVFPAQDGFLGILLPEDTNYQLLEIFEIILSNTTDFSESQYQHPQEEPVNSYPQLNQDEPINSYPQLNQDEEKLDSDDKSQKVKVFIEKSGKSIKKGFIKAAAFTSLGIKKGGEYLKKKMKKKDQPCEVPQVPQVPQAPQVPIVYEANIHHENNIRDMRNDQLVDRNNDIHEERNRKLKKASAVALLLSKALVASAVNATKDMGKWVSTRFIETKIIHEELSHNYQIAKKFGKTGLTVASTIYDGLEEALVIFGGTGILNDRNRK
ncbi:hypothetical protein SteCoe_1753 [Stentor coeruleus]|uniref:Senescence domain-containing protein n=1 Tax=Stentor coeruleus TaxID=5963 RepID=A0A1R2D0X7_9CILI|nr:hypothetical protein SteCoe_1753 [Stentor coeruleus]